MVVGSVNTDLVLEVARLPADGETLGAKSLNTFPGGKASLHSPTVCNTSHPTQAQDFS